MSSDSTRLEKPEIVMIDDMDLDRKVPDAEKATNVRTIDNIRVLGLTDDDAEFYNNTTPEQRKRIIRKVSLQ